jgi:hypothetical protein
MLAVSKPHGVVVLYHAENEGQRERYNQLHQWDFTCEDGSFVIRDRHGRETNVTNMFDAFCEVECSIHQSFVQEDGGRDAGRGILAALRKKGH